MVMFTSDKYGNNETDTKCLPSNKKCPGYTGDRMPNEQNYKEEATPILKFPFKRQLPFKFLKRINSKKKLMLIFLNFLFYFSSMTFYFYLAVDFLHAILLWVYL